MGKETKDYFIGLDMGTASLGWAVTDQEYNLKRAKGKDLWGVRLFEEAKTAAERRVNRVSRRRRQREKARVGLLRDYFADAIDEVDPGFYQRCEESKYRLEDRSDDNRQPFALFIDSGYTDIDYYKQYPTIYHLRSELIESKESHDVRLVYLAILNMFRHRGHFLNAELEDTSDLGSIMETYNEFYNAIIGVGINYPKATDLIKLEEILNKGGISRTKKVEEVRECLSITKSKENKIAIELIKLICGMSVKVSALSQDGTVDNEELLKKAFSFRDSDYDEKIYEIEDNLPDEIVDIIEKAKNVHDVCLLSNIRKNYTYLSQARVADYNKHKEDLDRLQSLVKKYTPSEYTAFFREMGVDNYSAYVGSVNSGKEKVRRCGKVVSRDDFYKRVKKLISEMPQDDIEVNRVVQDIENECFMPKQLTASNGVIPNQLHVSELRRILDNASHYLEFLNNIDDTGLTVKEQIEQIYKFQIPYYIGPLNNYHKDKGGNAWVVRKESGRVFPWNFDEKIDQKQSREEFIKRMVRRCTYLNDEKVLPKNSLLYEKFMVLNELNNLKIHNEKISPDLKQKIYSDLFMTGKRVTGKKLRDYLLAEGIISKEDVECISGIDTNFNASLSSIGKFIGILGKRVQEWDVQKVIEDIIFWGTIYSNDKKVVRESIEEHYSGMFSDNELKRILGLKFRDWGRLSKEFLELEGADKESGEVTSIIQMMWNENYNIMELLSDNFTFNEELSNRIKVSEATLGDFDFEDLEEWKLSAPVRRMVWQTLLVLKDIRTVMPDDPKRIFVEMARGGGDKGVRKDSRKYKFEELYKNCKDEAKDWLKEIKDTPDNKFRSKKLYLYYIQKGKCMYTGEKIELSDLFNDNMYDIDHIYPRHFVKDDNIDNNLVLVRKDKNAHKSDSFPIEEDIRKSRYAMWKSLHNEGFINDEKYKRLTRLEEFSDKDLEGFISRQLVETHQGTKVITQVLSVVLPNTEIVFPKGSNVSEFRKKYELLKVRNVNDFHHAQDAYLNVVVGNAYLVKFTRTPFNYIKDYRRDKNRYAYNMDKIFNRTIERNGEVAWIAADKEEHSGSIVTVKKVMGRNTPLMTKMNFEAHGGIANQTLYSASKAKNIGYLPLKTSDSHIKDVTKYGGMTNISTAYYFLVEHKVKDKKVRTIEMVPIYLKNYIEESDEHLIEYCINTLKLVNPDIRLKKIKMQSLIDYNGFKLNITGRTGTQLRVKNAMPLCINQKWITYIKKLNNYMEKGLEEGDITELTKENNIELYDILLDKHINGIYRKKPNALSGKMTVWREKFVNGRLEEEVEALVELLKISQCDNLSMDAKKLGFKSSYMLISKDISNIEKIYLINQSPAGIYESVIDLKTV